MNLCWLLVTLLCLSSTAVTAQQAASAAPSATPAPTVQAQATTPAATPLPKPQTPEEFFNRAREFSDLEAAGIPFHLKATFVATGDTDTITGDGAYEEWFQSKDVWRKEATLGSYRYVAISNKGQRMAYGSGSYVPLRLRQVESYVLLRLGDNPATKKYVSIKQKAANARSQSGSTGLMEIEYTYPFTEKSPRDILSKRTFEYTPDEVLRIQRDNSITLIYNHLQSFQNHLIPFTIDVGISNHQALAITITSLEPLSSIITTMFDPSITPQGFIKFHLPDDGETLHPKWTKIVLPKYPEAMRDLNLGGGTVIKCSIGPDGTMREPYVYISSGNLPFDAAILLAISQWTFEPPKVDGIPLTTHAFNFALQFALGKSRFRVVH